MNYLIKYLIGSLLILILFSCNNLRQLTTYWESEMESDSVMPTGYDPTTRVGWTSYNDSSHFFLAIDMLSAGVQMSVLRNGLTVYIDTTARLKEGCYLKFPVNGTDFSMQRPGRNRSAGRQNQQERIEPVEHLLSNFDDFVLEWKSGDKAIKTKPNQDDHDFICLAALDTLKNLSFLIGIPLDQIHRQGFEGINEFSVGFGIPMSSMGRMAAPGAQDAATMGSSQMGVRSGGGGRMTGGGGGRGGRGGGSMGGAQMGGAQINSRMVSSGPSIEKFWHRTTLGKKKD